MAMVYLLRLVPRLYSGVLVGRLPLLLPTSSLLCYSSRSSSSTILLCSVRHGSSATKLQGLGILWSPQGVNPNKGWAFRGLHKKSDGGVLLPKSSSSSSLEELEQKIEWAKENVRFYMNQDLAAAMRSGNEARITAATDLAAACKHLTALTEERLLVLKQNPTITKSFARADDQWITLVTGINPYGYKKWVERSEDFPNGYVFDEAVKPSDVFKAVFEQVSKTFHMGNEAGRRVLLNLFFSDVVVKFDGVLRIFPEIDMAVESGDKSHKLWGKIDYMVGFVKGEDIFGDASPQEVHLLALQPERFITGPAFWQCVAETAALYKSLVDAKKTTTAVWGIISNATTWEFIHIDDSGSLWGSEQFLIDLKCYKEAEILPVYRFIHYVVKRCFECCTTPNHLS